MVENNLKKTLSLNCNHHVAHQIAIHQSDVQLITIFQEARCRYIRAEERNRFLIRNNDVFPPSVQS